MYHKKVGQVIEKEKIEILILYERIAALKEAALTVNNDYITKDRKEVLIDKIKNEMSIVQMKYKDWWIEKFNKYQWNNHADGNWLINFHTNEIFIKITD